VLVMTGDSDPAATSDDAAGRRPPQPWMPSPPALQTAATRSGLVPKPIPPSTTGWMMPNSSQSGVVNMSTACRISGTDLFRPTPHMAVG